MYGTNKREIYHDTYLDPTSHNGIYHRTEPQAKETHEDHRDPLDLRIGKVVESTEIFAERNPLLSDTRETVPETSTTPPAPAIPESVAPQEQLQDSNMDLPLTPATSAITIQRREPLLSSESEPVGGRQSLFSYINKQTKDREVASTTSVNSRSDVASDGAPGPSPGSPETPPQRAPFTTGSQDFTPEDSRLRSYYCREGSGEYNDRRAPSPLPISHRLLSARSSSTNGDQDPNYRPDGNSDESSVRNILPSRNKRHKAPTYTPYPNVRLSPVAADYDRGQRRLASVDGHYDEERGWQYSSRIAVSTGSNPSIRDLDQPRSSSPTIRSPYATLSRVDPIEGPGSPPGPASMEQERYHHRRYSSGGGGPSENPEKVVPPRIKQEIAMPTSPYRRNNYYSRENDGDPDTFRVQKQEGPSNDGDGLYLRLKEEVLSPQPEPPLLPMTTSYGSQSKYDDIMSPKTQYVSNARHLSDRYSDDRGPLFSQEFGQDSRRPMLNDKAKKSDFLHRVLQEKLSKQRGSDKSSTAALAATAALLPFDSADVEQRLRVADQATRLHNIDDVGRRSLATTPQNPNQRWYSSPSSLDDRLSASTGSLDQGGGPKGRLLPYSSPPGHHPTMAAGGGGFRHEQEVHYGNSEYDDRAKHPGLMAGPNAMLKRLIHLQTISGTGTIFSEAMAAQMTMVGGPSTTSSSADRLISPTSTIQRSRYSPLDLGSTTSNMDPNDQHGGPGSVGSGTESNGGKGKRGRPRKHAPKIPLPPLYVFIRNMLHNRSYNPKIVSWVNEPMGVFKVNNTSEFARTWGHMKSNRSEEMNYEKMSRAMRYHYGSEKQGRKGHLAMVKEKRLVYRFGELAINWRTSEVRLKDCHLHSLCKESLCLWTKE